MVGASQKKYIMPFVWVRMCMFLSNILCIEMSLIDSYTLNKIIG